MIQTAPDPHAARRPTRVPPVRTERTLDVATPSDPRRSAARGAAFVRVSRRPGLDNDPGPLETSGGR